jgi:release factor glutamine methyltransferase
MTLSDFLAQSVDRLRNAGIDTPRLDAELIIVHALGLPRYSFISDPQKEIPSSAAAACEPFLRRRASREPLAYIFGTREFYGLDFAVDSRVLIPRPETELLVETAIALLPENGRMLDLCTGSGAVAAAVAHERPDCDVTGSDISSGALALAVENGTKLAAGRVRFVESDLFAAFAGETFDLVTANPPYISPDLEGTLQTELSFEPGIALYASGKGRAVIERIISEAAQFLRKGGALAMEIGFDQGDAVRALAHSAGGDCRIEKDLSGHDRVAIVKF